LFEGKKGGIQSACPKKEKKERGDRCIVSRIVVSRRKRGGKKIRSPTGSRKKEKEGGKEDLVFLFF